MPGAWGARLALHALWPFLGPNPARLRRAAQSGLRRGSGGDLDGDLREQSLGLAFYRGGVRAGDDEVAEASAVGLG